MLRICSCSYRLKQDDDEVLNNENELCESVCNGQCIVRNVHLFSSHSNHSVSLSHSLGWKRMLMWIIMLEPKTVYCCYLYFLYRCGMRNSCVHLFFTSKRAQNKYWSVLFDYVYECVCVKCIFTWVAFQQSIHLYSWIQTWPGNSNNPTTLITIIIVSVTRNFAFCSVMSVCV